MKEKKYLPIIKWLNNLPKNKIFTLNDICVKFEMLSKTYIKSLINILSSKEFYVGKNYKDNNGRKIIDSFYKRRNIPTDKSLEDIKWFLRTGI